MIHSMRDHDQMNGVENPEVSQRVKEMIAVYVKRRTIEMRPKREDNNG